MLKNNNASFGFLLLCLLFASCARQPCLRANSAIALISFTNAESDTVILRRFTRSTDFVTLKDTFILSSVIGNFQMRNDTTFIFQYVDQYNAITSTYDYEVSIPKANKVFRISNVTEDIRSIHAGLGKVNCINPIISYKLNGQLISGKNNYDFIYLTK
jgi:hypothetical protein